MARLDLLFRCAAPALASLALAAQSPLAPEVAEARLQNGIRVLLVERPGNGMVRAGLYFRGGSADTGALPPSAALLLVRCVFSALRPEDLGDQPELDALLQRADSLRESVRIEDLRRAHSFGSPGGEEDGLGLRAALRDTLERIGRLTTPPDQPDLLDGLGAIRRELSAEPDALVSALDLPAAAFAPWARLEARRLQAIRWSGLPRIRDLLDISLPGVASVDRLLLEGARPGLPYGRVMEPGGAAGVQLADLQGYARNALSPGRMAIVLAGDLKFAEALPILETTFGALPVGNSQDPDEPWTADPVSAPTGPKRILVRETGLPQMRIGWPVPSVTHPDRLPLVVLARLLGRRSGGRNLALPAFLGAGVKLGVPGGRQENLLVIGVRPEEGRGLAECEQEIQRTILRLQEESVAADSFEGALRGLDLVALQDQDDPEGLVRKLGMAWCQGGSWRLAFPDLRPLRREGPGAITRVARTYLRPERAVFVLAEPDVTRDPGDEGQVELFRLLRSKALARLGDPVKAEALAIQSMEQIRMLSREQRENLLQVLKRSGDRP